MAQKKVPQPARDPQRETVDRSPAIPVKQIRFTERDLERLDEINHWFSERLIDSARSNREDFHWIQQFYRFMRDLDRRFDRSARNKGGAK
jgi:hypothetical protein